MMTMIIAALSSAAGVGEPAVSPLVDASLTLTPSSGADAGFGRVGAGAQVIIVSLA